MLGGAVKCQTVSTNEDELNEEVRYSNVIYLRVACLNVILLWEMGHLMRFSKSNVITILETRFNMDYSLLRVADKGIIDLTRETREGWPLLTVETEMNGNSKSTYERGPSLDS